MRTEHRIIAGVIVAALWWAVGQFGCGDSGRGGGGTPDAGVVDRAVLEIVPPPGQDVGLRPGGEVVLKVRYTDGFSEPVVGGRVGFVLDGLTGGATLQAPQATSGADGIAQNVLRAGFEEAVFNVEVSAEGAGTIRYAVVVSNAGFGGMEVRVANLSNRTDDEVEITDILLYLGGACAEQDPADLAQAHKRRTIAGLDETAQFEFLPLDSSYAIAGLGRDNLDFPVLWGCVDVAEGQLKEGLTLKLVLPLDDLLADPLEEYLLQTELVTDIEGSQALSTALDKWADLGDCPNDPAEAVMDCIVAALQDPGLLPEDLDCDVEPTWGLALDVSDRRGVVAGACRSDEDAQRRESLEKVLTDAMASVTQVAHLRDLAGGSFSALQVMTLHSLMELQPLAGGNTFACAHTLYAVQFPTTPVEVFVDLADMVLPRREATGVLATRDPEEPSVLGFADHSVTLRIPRLMLRALTEGYLEGSSGSTVGQALTGMFDQLAPPAWYPQSDPLEACPLISAYVCHAVNRPNDCLQDGCERAIAALAAGLQREMLEAQYHGLDLVFASGVAPLDDLDGDLEAESMGADAQPGMWEITVLFVGGEQFTFPAVFTAHPPPFVPF